MRVGGECKLQHDPVNNSSKCRERCNARNIRFDLKTIIVAVNSRETAVRAMCSHQLRIPHSPTAETRLTRRSSSSPSFSFFSTASRVARARARTPAFGSECKEMSRDVCRRGETSLHRPRNHKHAPRRSGVSSELSVNNRRVLDGTALPLDTCVYKRGYPPDIPRDTRREKVKITARV